MSPQPAPLSILHVTQPAFAGVASVVRALVRDQVARRWHVTVACDPAGDVARWVRESGADVAPWTAGREPSVRTLSESIRLRGIIRATQPDLVHLHSSKAGLAGRIVIRGQIPTVFQPHAWSFYAVDGPKRHAAILWERLASRWTSVIGCVSQGEREAGEAIGIRARWEWMPTGVDLDYFAPTSGDAAIGVRQALGLRSDRVVVCVGRLARQKGQDVLLRAWPTVRAAVDDATLVLVGEGPLEARLRDLASPDVRFEGHIQDVRPYYAAAAVVVAPSRWEAALPIAAREGMSCGRSVVVSDVPGCRDDWVDGAGALFPSENVTALARELVQRLSHPAQCLAEGVVARDHALSCFAEDVASARVANVYHTLIGLPSESARN